MRLVFVIATFVIESLLNFELCNGQEKRNQVLRSDRKDDSHMDNKHNIAGFPEPEWRNFSALQKERIIELGNKLKPLNTRVWRRFDKEYQEMRQILTDAQFMNYELRYAEKVKTMRSFFIQRILNDYEDISLTPEQANAVLDKKGMIEREGEDDGPMSSLELEFLETRALKEVLNGTQFDQLINHQQEEFDELVVEYAEDLLKDDFEDTQWETEMTQFSEPIPYTMVAARRQLDNLLSDNERETIHVIREAYEGQVDKFFGEVEKYFSKLVFSKHTLMKKSSRLARERERFGTSPEIFLFRGEETYDAQRFFFQLLTKYKEDLILFARDETGIDLISAHVQTYDPEALTNFTFRFLLYEPK